MAGAVAGPVVPPRRGRAAGGLRRGLAARRRSGVVLAVTAEPVAISLTEYVLKPAIGRVADGWLSFPSGHATAMFALAAICAVLLTGPGRRLPAGLRWLLILAAFAVAAAVAATMVAIGAHYVTDVVGGAAVGIGVVLACALSLDLLTSQLRRGRAARPAPGG